MAVLAGLGTAALVGSSIAFPAFDILKRIRDNSAERTAGILRQQQEFQAFDAIERKTERLNSETDLRRALAQLAPDTQNRMAERMELQQIIGQQSLLDMQRARVTVQPSISQTLRGIGIVR